MRFVLPSVVVIVYWLIEAYRAVINFDTPFMKAILLDYEHSNPIIKLIIVSVIFILLAVKTKFKINITKNRNTRTTEDLSAICSISDIILAPISLQKQLDGIVMIVKKELNAEATFIASFEGDTIVLISTCESFEKIGIKRQYQPLQTKLENKSIDKLLSKSYLEKIDYIEDIVKINGTMYRAILQSCKEAPSRRAMGIMVTLLEKNSANNHKSFLTKVGEQTALTINLARKKDEAVDRQNTQLTSIDNELNIYSNSKLQETIEHEIKRSQRYATHLTIILISIDYMKNLSNIFSDKETVALKKEVAAVLKKDIRETDIFGKWSGNNFAIVVADIDHRAAKKFAIRLNWILEEHKFHRVGKVTCSYGITSFSPKDTIGTFRKRAEDTLRKAIEKDDNTIEIKVLPKPPRHRTGF